MEITNEIKEKVFAQYYPCKFKNGIDDKQRDVTLDGIKTLAYAIVGKCQLILKPLSKISEEDAYEVARMLFSKEYKGHYINYSNHSICVTVMIPNTTINHSVNISFDGNLSNVNGYGLRNMLEAYQYLQSKGYDLPQHLLGGKTLQEAGLAIY